MKNMKKVLKNIYQSFHWFFFLFLKHPRLELYVRKQNIKNRAYFSLVKTNNENKNDLHLKPYYVQTIPKIIWIYWEQGVKSAPLIVKECINRWEHLNAGWQIKVLDRNNISEYIEYLDLPETLPVRYRADMLRINLLNKYGGVWADATTYCHRSLDEWLPLMTSSGFFMFSNPAEDRDIESWFIASTPNHPLIAAWEQKLKEYLSSLRDSHPAYFIMFYLFQWTLKHDYKLSKIWRRCATINATPCFFMKSSYMGITDISELAFHLRNGLPMSKLDWRLEVTNESLANFLKRIDAL